MRLIPLYTGRSSKNWSKKRLNGLFAMVDDEDFEYLNQFKWSSRKNNQTYYVRRYFFDENGGRGEILMHRELLGLKKGDGIFGDHKDRNGFNNQKNNLRISNKHQNGANRRSAENTTSSYLGVMKIVEKRQFKEDYVKWRASMKLNGKTLHIGTFKTEENAAIAYNIFAEKYHGEFANYNKA